MQLLEMEKNKAVTPYNPFKKSLMSQILHNLGYFDKKSHAAIKKLKKLSSLVSEQKLESTLSKHKNYNKALQSNDIVFNTSVLMADLRRSNSFSYVIDDVPSPISKIPQKKRYKTATDLVSDRSIISPSIY